MSFEFVTVHPSIRTTYEILRTYAGNVRSRYVLKSTLLLPSSSALAPPSHTWYAHQLANESSAPAPIAMPIRVKSRPGPGAGDAPRSPSPAGQHHVTFFEDFPDVTDHDSFRELIRKLSLCVHFTWKSSREAHLLTTFPHRHFNEIILLPVTFEQLRTTSAGAGVQNLVEHLSDTCRNPAIVNALL